VIEDYYGRNATTTARATVLGGKSGSYQRARDELQMLLLTAEQLHSAAYALAGYEKWLPKQHGTKLKKIEKRKVVEQLLTSAELKFKNADVKAVVEEAAQVELRMLRITKKLDALYTNIRTKLK